MSERVPDAPRVEVRARADVLRLLERGLDLARVVPSADHGVRSAAWIRLVLAEAGAIPPPGAIADLGWLALGESVRYGGRHSDPPVVAGSVRAYEDEVLGRLAADPRLEDVRTAIGRIPDADRDRAVARFVVELLGAIGHAPSIALAPGALRPGREVGSRAEVQTAVGADGAPRVEPELTDAVIDGLLADGYRALVRAARRAGPLLPPSLVFQLEHFAELPGEAGRLACVQAVAASAAFDRALPRRAVRRAARDASVATALDDASTFPAGGYAEVSTRGGLDNLVPSELIYMDPDRAGEVDWFDARFAEGSLLCYARDEGLYTRPRRAITFVFVPDLVRARVLDPGQRAQRLVLALGLVCAVVGRLIEWLSDDSLVIELAWVADPAGDPPLAAERGILEVLLAAPIRRGVVGSLTVADVAAARRRAEDHARRGASDVVVVSAGAGKGAPSVGARAVEHTLVVDGPAPRLGGAPVVGGDPFDAWSAAACELAKALA